uniref:putative DNA topoisomerase IIA n=1 Tax=Cafeteria roenbergensis virus (strain BV-PW1) TaxID=693272 RepID=UPI0001E7AE96|nr:putative DNA topoisomerase IIA [Cafeteria roenbergensis virus BV-PW1]
MSKTKYDKVSQREHILLRPGMYIGSVSKNTEPMWLYEDNKMQKKDITFIPGLYKIYDEIIVNARDHSINDKSCNSIEIEVNTDEGYFSVYNNGDEGIPVKEHETHKTLIPSMIFGELLTSSNYDDSKKRTTGGMNGLGSKCSNVWSKKFEIEVQDKTNKKHFHQIWEDNMSVVNKPKVTSKSTKSFVKVTCYPDLERFKIKSLKKHLPLFEKRAYDLALTTEKVKVKFNGSLINVKNMQDFMDLYFPDTAKIVDTSNPRMHVGCIYLPDVGHESISYVNGICSYRGGTHCNYIVDMVVKSLINDYIKKKDKDIKISPALIKDNLVFFINSVIDNPSFSSQSKETLTTKPSDFGTVYKLNKTFMTKLSKSGIIKQIISLAKFKESVKMTKTDGRKTTVIRGIPKLEDANKAGTKDAHKCGLYLAEGDSALSMILSGLSSKDRNFYGAFPLKGKLLNVREASVKQIMGNDEISNLKKILGLRNEFKYEMDEEFNTLRYGKVIILCDSDVDGSHIKGLILNMFHSMWPNLLKREGFITTMNTPIVKATKGKEILKFYNLTDYDNWRNDNNTKGYYIKYYKGLGTSDSKEAKEYFQDIEGSLIDYTWDTNKSKTKGKTVSDDAIELAFSKELADKRKEWLINYDKNLTINSNDRQIPVPDFINKDLIHFSNDDTQRSIPSLVDGFKPSQRKIFYGANLRGLEKDQVKVAQLAGFVSDRVAYHHGEASLMGAIIGMAQNFVGSNNVNLLEPKGQFGSRVMGGKDSASPRYIWTKLEKVAGLIFRKEDNPILNYINDDGLMVEPEFYLPIIPMILVNGATGIGTGFSTSIPCYHPQELIEVLKKLIKGEKYKKIHPYYHKFEGKLKKLDTTSYQVSGTYHIDKKNNIVVEELPVGEWTTNYKQFLEKMLDTDTNFTNYDNNSTDEKILITLKFKNIPTKLDEKLKMNKKINLTNLHAYTEKGHIQKFKNIDEIINNFYYVRLEGYYNRKKYLLEIYKHQMDIMKYKVKFIKEIINKTLIINNKKKLIIEQDLETKKYPKMGKNLKDEINYDYLLGMNLYSLTKEKIEELEKQKIEKEEIYTNLKNKTPEELWEDDLEELNSYFEKNY